MIKVGLTGNIGSGKSTVARIFKVLGVPVYHADEESKKFLNEPKIQQILVRKFGKEILSGSIINRKRLAEIVFAQSESLDFLNSVLHPLVKNDIDFWIKKHLHFPYIIQEAAILFESGFYKEFDKIITVTCPGELAVKRVMDRDDVTMEEVHKRMQNQWEQVKKVKLSDFIIDNSNNILVTPQVLKIHKELPENK
ncbi:MAG: dephospho-CoA kinase [Bacteroidales bacterium]|nr:dephospho-CoA kinase [Bacteroidales bacterium]